LIPDGFSFLPVTGTSFKRPPDGIPGRFFFSSLAQPLSLFASRVSQAVATTLISEVIYNHFKKSLEEE
jgi:hypothetical protein